MRNIDIGTDDSVFTITSDHTPTFISPVVIDATEDTRADAGAVSIATYYTKVTTTGAAAITLADGTVLGQLKKIQMTVDTGDATLTPSNFADGTTVTFADIGDTVELIWNGTNWRLLSAYNCADGTSAPAVA